MLEIDNVDIRFLLSPRSPKLNGGVERFHRIVREEFWSFCSTCSLSTPLQLRFNSAYLKKGEMRVALRRWTMEVV